MDAAGVEPVRLVPAGAHTPLSAVRRAAGAGQRAEAGEGVHEPVAGRARCAAHRPARAVDQGADCEQLLVLEPVDRAGTGWSAPEGRSAWSGQRPPGPSGRR